MDKMKWYKWIKKLPLSMRKDAILLILWIEEQENQWRAFKFYGSSTRNLPGGYKFFEFWLWLRHTKLNGNTDDGGSTYVDNLGVCDTLGSSWEQGRFCGCYSDELASEYWLSLPLGLRLTYGSGCGDYFYLNWNPWKNEFKWNHRGSEDYHRHETEDAI